MAKKLDKQTRLILMVVGIFVGVLALGMGVYFAAFYEPPRKHVVLQQMVRDMIAKIDLHFDAQNQMPRELEDDLRWYIYNPPVSIKEGQVTTKYRKSDTRPAGDLQRLYFWDANAVVLLGVPCNNVYPIFDTALNTNSPDKMINETCPHANHFYYAFSFRPGPDRKESEMKYMCVRCGKVYQFNLELGYRPEEVNHDAPESPFHKDISDENGVYGSGHLKAAQEIAAKNGISREKIESSVLNALTYAWIKWPDTDDPEELAEYKRKWEETEEQYRIPLGFRGRIRFAEIVRVFDPMPRVNRREENQEPVRYDRISELPPERTPEEQMLKPFGYMLWRTDRLRVLEVEFEYRNGNVTFKNWNEPTLLVDIEPFHRDPAALKKGEEMAKEREAKLKAVRAKKGEMKDPGGPK
jgi:hypothetical protein